MIDHGPSTELYLLDTHVWIWAYHGERDRFSERGLESIAAAAAPRRTCVSAISIAEFGRAVARGRIAIDVAVDDWIAGAVAAFSGEVIPIDWRVALESTRLPNLGHKDPGDRFLVATARALNARLVTVDDILLDYGRTGHLKVFDPRK